jgi:hypothetical protein
MPNLLYTYARTSLELVRARHRGRERERWHAGDIGGDRHTVKGGLPSKERCSQRVRGLAGERVSWGERRRRTKEKRGGKFKEMAGAQEEEEKK